ncbi:alpha/beta hydrolase [Companilactobacillus allii]|uniref:Alpha/beta hydrolase n=1 Tax=Companilactobacillus allii TaxID=1847728 RepID=A0A1P8Q4F2_9LACO|nr:alpha/beta hydrolase [Companilactobacillus allii]APX72742.1 alpha/beta hydrolase [Companilactobacillus allii]USQ67528.1 alpha/beta hydrolase [Companilactobacillus allii]
MFGKKILKITLISLVGVFVVADLAGGAYLFNYAFKKGNYASTLATGPLKGNNKWFNDQDQKIWTEKSKDGLTLKARYLPAEQQTNKTVIVVHGYGSASKYMGSFVKIFHDAGYNVLAPDNRSFGLSGGEYAGYGWKDRSDMLGWISRVNKKNGSGSQIGLYGISMGAATVMYTLGKQPQNVKWAIEDCGYSTISGELNYQLKEMFHLPSFPLVPTAAIYSKIFAGYNFYEANTKDTLKRSHVPLFLIHGSKDTFVPVSNVYENYKNANDPKKLWVVKGAEHGQSYNKDKAEYIKKVTSYANHYFK